MSWIGNLLWIVLGGGIFIFLEYVIGGVLLCLTIIGIPFGCNASNCRYWVSSRSARKSWNSALHPAAWQRL